MTVVERTSPAAAWVDRGVAWFVRHWLAVANVSWGTLVGLPWLAPVLMKVGATGPARAIYFVYSFLCHQYANRSFFLFGPRWMYTYTELLPYAPDADTWWGLRAFVGTPELGYKVAWSDRMVWMYGTVFVGGLVFALIRGRVRPLNWRLFVALLLPMAVDGGTHAVSDLWGVGRGFRYANDWLAALTAHAFAPDFYVGNAPGSFNFWMRLLTGLLFGVAVVWLAYPLVDRAFRALVPARTNIKG